MCSLQAIIVVAKVLWNQEKLLGDACTLVSFANQHDWIHCIQITLLMHSVTFRLKYAAIHATLLERVSSGEFGYKRTPDDSVRFQSFLFALARAVDKIVLLARAVVQDGFVRNAGTRRLWQRRRLWLGK